MLLHAVMMIGYWHHTVVCLSVRLSVTNLLWLNRTLHPTAKVPAQ